MSSKIITGILLAISVVLGIFVIQNTWSNDTVIAAPIQSDLMELPSVSSRLPEGWNTYSGKLSSFEVCYPNLLKPGSEDELSGGSILSFDVGDRDPYPRMIVKKSYSVYMNPFENDNGISTATYNSYTSDTTEDRFIKIDRSKTAVNYYAVNDNSVQDLLIWRGYFRQQNGTVLSIELQYPSTMSDAFDVAVKTIQSCAA